MSPHALKGQKLLAQGSALGIKYNNKHTPYKGKSFKILSDNKAFALSGRMELTYESSFV